VYYTVIKHEGPQTVLPLNQRLVRVAYYWSILVIYLPRNSLFTDYGIAAAIVIYLPRNSLFTDYGTAAAIVILTQEIHYSPTTVLRHCGSNSYTYPGIHYSPTTAVRHCGSNSYTHPEFIIHRLRHFIEEVCLVTASDCRIPGPL